MMYFEDRLKEFERFKKQIYRDQIDYSKFSISLDEIDQIDDIYSLFKMYKNGVLGQLEEEFNEKLDNLDTKLTRSELIKLMEKIDI